MKTIIPNPDNLEKIKEKIKEAGCAKLHVLADFDRTLTYGSVDGKKTPSIISMLRDGKHLNEGYAKIANALFEKYHHFETDPNISLAEKKSAMQEWWETHNRLLIESGLRFVDLEDIVANGHVKFRDGVQEFLDFLRARNIPLVIFSSSGCGDAIQLFFKKINRDYPNIFYVTNKFEWASDGRAIRAKEPIIHSANKDETLLKEIPEVYSAVKDRTNVVLLGDNIEDIGMIEGFNYDNLLKIGFLNFDFDKLRDDYKKNFDIILEGDGNFNEVNALIRELE